MLKARSIKVTYSCDFFYEDNHVQAIVPLGCTWLTLKQAEKLGKWLLKASKQKKKKK